MGGCGSLTGMPIFRITDEHRFPHPTLADSSGLLGVGGDLDPDRLLLAYANGIFPWFDEPPVLWWSPDPRMVLEVEDLRVPRSTRKHLRRSTYTVTLDMAFDEVLRRCAETRRPGQQGTWITTDMQQAYLTLHERGFAHSAEAWMDGELVGGLYGVALGRLFAGESMFAVAPDASKVAFVTMVQHLASLGFPLVDCQIHTEHLARFGAKLVERDVFLDSIAPLVRQPSLRHRWRLGSAQDAPARQK